MPPTNLLRRYGLARNPYTDRTAEKTELDDTCLYVHSDLHNFKPSEETYLFFGKRGSGKTTIRLAMQRAYEQANADLARNNEPEHFLVDLCSPGHMTSCLKDFQARTPKCPSVQVQSELQSRGVMQVLLQTPTRSTQHATLAGKHFGITSELPHL
jgi:energy-coupling factor transporter ATP-binding protein EcfA2